MQPLKYLVGYPEHLLAQVRTLIEQDRLGAVLGDRYGDAHGVRNDRQLYDYTLAMKERYLRKSAPLGKVLYDNRLHAVKHALGTHATVSRVQGNRLKASREIRIASLFRDAPADFLKMIVAHELAHLRENDHNKSFYQLCTHMAPAYHQLEFDLRLYLTHLEMQRPAPGGPYSGGT
jgi:predicted metal-dependent hydrolase